MNHVPMPGVTTPTGMGHGAEANRPAHGPNTQPDKRLAVASGMAQPMHPMPPSAAQKHAVLARHMGRVQARVSALLTAQQTALHALQAENVWLRGQLVAARTSALWGLALRPTGGWRPAPKTRHTPAQGQVTNPLAGC